jgi:N-acyl-D-amino-acid deacylase
MKYDLLIKGGTVIDGTGRPRFDADIGIVADEIVAIGNLGTNAADVIDASGKIVSPGFVDAHTHMDAQIFWDPLGTCSCFHGVTSVVMGNCGFTLAPVNVEDIDLVLENLEEAEAIPADVLAAGVEFKWKTFAEFFDVLDDLPKGINYAGYVGHSALRTFAMRERAFTDTATAQDLGVMAAALQDGLNAGAIGFSTSRNPSHIRPGGEPVVSRVATWTEVEALMQVMTDMGKGIFEISREGKDPLPADVSVDFNTRLKRLAIESGRPVTLGIFSVVQEPGLWKKLLEMVEETNAQGGKMVAQVHSNTMYEYHTLRTDLPYDSLEPWQALKKLSPKEQKTQLFDPDVRRRLCESARGMPVPPDYEKLKVVERFQGPDVSVADLVRETGRDAPNVIVDHLSSASADAFFRTPFANEADDDILGLIQHPNSVVTFSDSGAHVSQIADFSLHTHFLSHWVRERRALTLEEAVRRITSEIAHHWGLTDRGVLSTGKKADVTIFDADHIAPLMPEVATDLPLNGVRLRQGATGVHATVVNGQVLLRDGEHTGALPGHLLRQ